MKNSDRQYDAIVIGGGPSGATAATELARSGASVLLIDKRGRIKPCGGAVPPRLVEEFDIPEHLLVAKVASARMVAPSNTEVDMPINGGYVGMVDRGVFDEWLRERASEAGADRLDARVESIVASTELVTVTVREQSREDGPRGKSIEYSARVVVGADGANSQVAKQCVPSASKLPYVAAYHEIVESPAGDFDGKRCDVYYQGDVSPDFYGWVFPHGEVTSVGVGSANKGFSLRAATGLLRERTGLTDAPTVRREGAPIPLRMAKRWDNGRNVILAGDAAGVVAPASGEGIYYAMLTGKLAGEAAAEALLTNDARALADARKRFVREHGKVFWVLGMMQHFWYRNDKRRERFVSICRDPDVQDLTWQAYMHKRLVRAKPMAHARIFFKDLAHLFGMASTKAS